MKIRVTSMRLNRMHPFSDSDRREEDFKIDDFFRFLLEP